MEPAGNVCSLLVRGGSASFRHPQIITPNGVQSGLKSSPLCQRQTPADSSIINSPLECDNPVPNPWFFNSCGPGQRPVDLISKRIKSSKKAFPLGSVDPSVSQLRIVCSNTLQCCQKHLGLIGGKRAGFQPIPKLLLDYNHLVLCIPFIIWPCLGSGAARKQGQSENH